MPKRIPAEVFHPGEFIQDEMDERGWTTSDVAARMPGDPEVNLLALDIYLSVRDRGVLLDRKMAEGLGVAFGVSAQLFINLDDAWRQSVHG